ncbi:MAG: hypothetical protein DYG89_07415 [Caldilinea sp. CFX5]|nr:hypothetical protein [Caldilinea sp. CFX5]
MPVIQDFDILSDITDIETIARGLGVDARHYLNRTYGRGRWRKMKGRAWIRLKRSSEEFLAELHWFEANGIGRCEMKRKFRIKGGER